MIRLRTIGQVSVHIGDKPVPATNELIIASLLYLVAERGRTLSRKVFSELFFAEGGGHSGRQLIYRLRHDKGVAVDGDQGSIVFSDSVEWDVEQLLSRGTVSDEELEAMRKGYLADFGHDHTEAFSRWLDEHRSSVTRRVRELLIPQIQAARAKRDYRMAGKFANACLGLDPLNEAATLAAAESLAATGSKTDALHLLDRYLEDVGPRSDLRIAPRLLRERIAEYVIEPDRDQTALIGRSDELRVLRGVLDESAAGRPQLCLISGQGGIGKTRLVEEACAVAALTGHAIAHSRLTPPDIDRPFAILRDLGPTLLDLPGALGAAPDALAAVRGLCGRGPTQYSRRPANAYDARAVTADIQRKVIDLITAVADEQPLVVRIENADYIDEASLELVESLAGVGKRVCVFLASRVALKISDDPSIGIAVSRLHLPPLRSNDSSELVQDLFNQAGREHNALFTENAVRISAGIPLFLHLLFKNFLVTGDPAALPSTLSDSLTARLDQLTEPAKGVLDVVVTLGALSTVRRIEQVSELPKYALALALRTLEEQGFLRSSEGAVLASHDLLADATRRRMPPSVSQLLHRTVAGLLEADAHPDVDPHEVAIHWQSAGENARASEVIIHSARRSIALGRPRQAITLLQSASEWSVAERDRAAMDTALLEACHAAGEEHLGFAAAERVGGLSETAASDIQVMAFEMAVGAGKVLAPFRHNLEVIAANHSLDSALRCRAGRLLLIIADDLGDLEAANAAMALLADTAVDSSEAIIPRLIFEVVFGSTDSAIDIANRLCESAKTTPTRGIALQAMWTAALGLWRCGESDRACEIATEGFQLAQASAVWSACLAFGSLIGNLAWQKGEARKCQEWFDRTGEMMKRSGGPDRGYQHLEMGISLALQRGDAPEALRLLDEATRLFPEFVNERFSYTLLAYRVTIKMALGERPSEQEVQDLVAGHRKRRSLGLHDHAADATIAVLMSLDRLGEADVLREEYLTRYRKERTPASPLFRHLNNQAPYEVLDPAHRISS